MQYQAGRVGRIFYICFDHKDDLLQEFTALIRREDVRCGWFQFFGGLTGAEVVIGPEEPCMPPVPVWQRVSEARELFACGSVFWEGDEPRLHLHGAMGHHGETLTGCIRKNVEVYLLVEAVLFEMEGMEITRPWYPEGGFNRPRIGK